MSGNEGAGPIGELQAALHGLAPRLWPRPALSKLIIVGMPAGAGKAAAQRWVAERAVEVSPPSESRSKLQQSLAALAVGGSQQPCALCRGSVAASGGAEAILDFSLHSDAAADDTGRIVVTDFHYPCCGKCTAVANLTGAVSNMVGAALADGAAGDGEAARSSAGTAAGTETLVHFLKVNNRDLAATLDLQRALSVGFSLYVQCKSVRWCVGAAGDEVGGGGSSESEDE